MNIKKFIPTFFVIVVTVVLFLIIHPAFTGKLGGTLKAHAVPNEYITFERFLSSQPRFSRTLWVPTVHRFGFSSSIHPAISAEDFYHVTSISGVINSLKKNVAEKQLQEDSVRYVVVPYDAEGEIFLKDRKYDNQAYLYTIQVLQHIPWLHEISGFGHIKVFTITDAEDHFYLPSHRRSISYTQVNPTEYRVQLKNVKKGELLVFSESYDRQWNCREGKIVVFSQKYHILNSFTLPKSGSYTLTVFYEPQKWVTIGLWISSISICFIGFLLVFLAIKGKR